VEVQALSSEGDLKDNHQREKIMQI